ncbi:hypothetical protein EG329_009265 [Mollisiaceae sp. DMI_Dod_QoI]|nr:hypothetical protein EG329_009265 [Helotiales sp. DMI_Dod_QoI]
MAGADRRSSTGIDRRASGRISMSQQDDDDYDLEAMGVSDGFRPSTAMTGHNRISSQTSQHNPPGRRTPPPRPSSTTKPKLDSFALRHDGGMGSVARNNPAVASNSHAGPTRSSSVSTDMAYVRAESPYQGPSGPSHPYQMYPQESRLARTMSVVTTSTVAVPDRPYNGPGGPAHPYGMYPQNTVPEGEAGAEAEPLAPVPVGFPGLNNNYQRRLGPEGEEIADIIGPDGHTEQLPPYTQYPDETIARKARPNVQVPLPGAGGIGLATRNPEFESQEDLNTPQSRHSTRSIMSDSNHQVNMAAANISEKPPLKKWQLVARRKVCMVVPIWAIVLAAIVFILFAIILGTVLAILKPKHPQSHKYKPGGNGNAQSAITVMTTMTTTFDATPLATSPAGLPTLPTGTYALPITAPSAIQNSCILNTAMSAAWTCTIPMTSYTIAIDQILGASSDLDNNEVNLNLGNNTFGNYYAYGTQPPLLTQEQVLHLVTDSQEPSRGPAWFFELPYNKLVILPEGALTAPTSKRDLEDRDGHTIPEFMMRKNVAEPGDKPWFCYWNGTLLEAFIYVNLTSSAGRQTSTTSSSAPSSTWKSGASSTYGASAASSTGQSSGSSSGSSQQMTWTPAYPKVLKIEERRIPRGAQSISPYCIQHQIDPYGNAQPYLNSTGQPVTLYLSESEPSSVSQITGKRSPEDSLERDLEERQSSGSCGCVWLWT